MKIFKHCVKKEKSSIILLYKMVDKQLHRRKNGNKNYTDHSIYYMADKINNVLIDKRYIRYIYIQMYMSLLHL